MDDSEKKTVKVEHRTITAESGGYHLTGGEAHVVVVSRLPKEHPYYALIGRVASNWTHFELMLDRIIWDLSGFSQPTALCITGHIMGVVPRFKMIESLSQKIGLSRDDLKPLRVLKERHYNVGERRNRIVHDPWFYTKDSDDPAIIGQTSQLKATGDSPVSEDEILEVIEKIYQLTNEAGILRNSLNDAVQTLREKRT